VTARRPIDERLREANLPALPRTAWLEIDLDALATNLAVLRGLAGPRVRVEPVVKADAYGHGAVPVAQALEAAGADGFSVATLDEALILRRSGIRRPILVLFPVPPEEAARAVRRGIGLTGGDRDVLDRLLAAFTADRDRGLVGGRALHVQLEIETGLGRGGIQAAGLADAVRAIRRTPGARLDGVWSHLTAAEDSNRTRRQQQQFDDALRALADSGMRAAVSHLASSGGLLAGVTAYEAIRPGLSIYGLVPDGMADGPAARGGAAALRPVMALRARPVRVADLPAGWGVSYGPSFETRRSSRIATLPLGYGDGWPRALSNRAEALVRGRRVPLVGTVAMDAIMADVTDVRGAPVGVDDEFTLLGEDGAERITALDLARSRATISWEVVTSMSRRLPRVYHAAAGVAGLRTLAHGETAWHPSSSGMATSVSSRSTRS
jgi:alanine racemase